MLIQPVKPVMVLIKFGQHQYDCRMVSLSPTELALTCNAYLEKGTEVSFLAQYFRGSATIKGIEFVQYCFQYTLEIENIQFRPGLLVNYKL